MKLLSHFISLPISASYMLYKLIHNGFERIGYIGLHKNNIETPPKMRTILGIMGVFRFIAILFF